MKKYFFKAREKYEREGIYAFVKSIYWFVVRCLRRIHPKNIYSSHIRPRTPISLDRSMQMNGVTVHPFRSWDSIIGHDLSIEEPEVIEAGAADAIQRYVKEGDNVVVVGGGWGITTTIAAQKIGETGSVVVYEGASNMVDQIRDTVKTNNVAERVDIHHGIVGNSYSLTGYAGGADEINPSELKSCDVLEMDCEGAETDIIPELDIQPEYIIVETHNNYDEVENLLADIDYNIISKAPAEIRVSEDYVEKNELYTVVAEHK